MTDHQAVVPQSRTELWRLEQLALISRLAHEQVTVVE